MSSNDLPRATLRTNALLLSIVLGLAACGGGGSDPVTSAPAPAPAPVQAAAIVTQPAPQSGAIGGAVMFTIAATGTDLAYQWRRDGKNIAGATAASYTLSNLQAEDDGTVFTVEVKNSAGSVVSAGAALQVAVPKGLSLLAGQIGGQGNLEGLDGRLWLGAQAMGASPAGPIYVGVSAAFPAKVASLRTVDPATGAIATVQRFPDEEHILDIEFDAAGNRYDMLMQSIYKTTPGGVRTLLAGGPAPAGTGGTNVSVDGAGAKARFGSLADMTIDRDGNIYVADVGSGEIRKVDPAGNVVTLAGKLGAGYDGGVDGTGSNATFQWPRHIAVDPAGNVFVTDGGVYAAPTTLRKLTPSGTVTTVALKDGSAPGTAVEIGNGAGALAADAAGNLYMTTGAKGCRIRRIGADGTLTDLAGSATATGAVDGKGAAARFCAAVSSGNLTHLTTDKAGNLLVLDLENGAVRRVTLDGDVTTIGGHPPHIANIDGNGAAAAFALAGLQGPAPTEFFNAYYALAVDAQGNAYVGEADRIRKTTPSGTVTTLPTPAGAPNGARYYPGGLGYGGGAVVIHDNVINRIDANGTLRFVAGQAGSHGTPDGTGANAAFNKPYDPIVDGFGNIYVHDVAGTGQDRKLIDRKISPDGVVTTLPVPANNQAVAAWYADKDGKVWAVNIDGSVFMIGTDGKRTALRAAPSTSVRVPALPTAITRDAAGNLYLGEMNDASDDTPEFWSAVRRIAADGTETIVAGTKGSSGVRLGSPGSLGWVEALAVGPDGILYVMSENAVLRLKQ